MMPCGFLPPFTYFSLHLSHSVHPVWSLVRVTVVIYVGNFRAYKCLTVGVIVYFNSSPNYLWPSNRLFKLPIVYRMVLNDSPIPWYKFCDGLVFVRFVSFRSILFIESQFFAAFFFSLHFRRRVYEYSTSVAAFAAVLVFDMIKPQCDESMTIETISEAHTQRERDRHKSNTAKVNTLQINTQKRAKRNINDIQKRTSESMYDGTERCDEICGIKWFIRPMLFTPILMCYIAGPMIKYYFYDLVALWIV